LKIRDIMDFWQQKAPLETAEEWDNPGLLAGDPDAEVTGVLTALDITPQAVEAATKAGANLIISHHPVIFSPLRRLAFDGVPCRLVRHGIAALCLHTNLDKADGGVNDALIARLGWPKGVVAEDGLCRVVTLPQAVEPNELAQAVSSALGGAVRVHAGDHPVRRIAVCSGGGGEDVLALAERVDGVLTGEIRHHEWLELAAAGVTALDAGHYATEIMAADALAAATGAAFPMLAVTAFAQDPPYKTITE
jgi:dinuclear metal center YbgI/SA1388 family protein